MYENLGWGWLSAWLSVLICIIAWSSLNVLYDVLIASILTLILAIILLTISLYFIDRDHFKDNRRLSKVLLNWDTYRILCKECHINCFKLRLLLLESNEKKMAWEYAENFFRSQHKKHQTLLKEIQDLKQSKERDRNDKNEFIREIFREHYYIFFNKLSEKIENEKSQRYHDFSNKIMSSLNKKVS